MHGAKAARALSSCRTSTAPRANKQDLGEVHLMPTRGQVPTTSLSSTNTGIISQSDRDELANFAIERATTLHDTIALIDKNAAGMAVVIDSEGHLVDVVTDGDIRRAILCGIALSEKIDRVLEKKRANGATHPPVTARMDDPPDFLLMLMERLVLHQIPLMDAEGRVRKIVHRDALSTRPKVVPGSAAVVMAGGFGVRLRPLTENTPKPMLKVSGYPILEHSVRRLVSAGIDTIYITLHYLPDVITSHFGDGSRFGAKIEYIREDKPLGTAGSVSLARHGGFPLLVMNGDVITDLNFVSLFDFHRNSQALITMAAAPYEVGVPYGVIEADGTKVTGLEEKPTKRFYINTGIYVVSPEACALIPHDTVYNMTDLVEHSVSAGKSVRIYAMHEYWRDIGRIEDLQRVNLEMSNERITR